MQGNMVGLLTWDSDRIYNNLFTTYIEWFTGHIESINPKDTGMS